MKRYLIGWIALLALCASGIASAQTTPINLSNASAPTYLPAQSVTSAMTFTVAPGGQAGANVYWELLADGNASHVPTFRSFQQLGGNTWNNTAGQINYVRFWFDGQNYFYSIDQLGVGYSAGSSGAATYVTTAGNDSNSCLSWASACATIQSAIGKLPTNGGLVEVGYGTFGCFTVDNSSSGYNIGVHIRGRGIGSWWNPATLSSSNATYQANQHATIISNTTANADCITLKGNTANYSFPDSFVLEDLAVQGVTGAGATRDGIVINYVPHLTMRRVVSQSNGRYGINIQNSYWLLLDTVRGEFNTSDGLNTSNTVNLLELSNDVFDDNGGNGATLGPGQAVLAHNSDFSRNTSHGVQMSNGGPFTLINNFIEANLSSGITNSACGGNYNIFYNEFSGNNAQTYGISALCSAANGDVWNIVGNSFNSGDKFCSIELQQSDPNGYIAANQAQGEGVAGGGGWVNCFIVDDPAGTTKIVYSGSAQQQARAFLLNQRNLITLGAAGNITLDRNLGQYQIVTLNVSQGANTTTITNGHKGDLISIEWLQGGAGSFTYVWPANVKFAAGTAPTASTATGSRDIVTFEYDVTAGNWYEISRSIGVH